MKWWNKGIKIPVWEQLDLHSYIQTLANFEKFSQSFRNVILRTSQLTFTCSKSTLKTLEKGAKYVQS